MSSDFEEGSLTRRQLTGYGDLLSSGTHYPSAKVAISRVFFEATVCIGPENPPHLSVGPLPFREPVFGSQYLGANVFTTLSAVNLAK